MAELMNRMASTSAVRGLVWELLTAQGKHEALANLRRPKPVYDVRQQSHHLPQHV